MAWKFNPFTGTLDLVNDSTQDNEEDDLYIAETIEIPGAGTYAGNALILYSQGPFFSEPPERLKIGEA